jgi:hypothetical protein
LSIKAFFMSWVEWIELLSVNQKQIQTRNCQIGILKLEL